ncbi:MAG: hypothetical protein K5928_00985 [Prevotella sp.]|nr:hypothetical protein [Prevotella sp.]
MERKLLLGNTEVGFLFCPEEILYISTIPNMEKCEVFLVNGQKYEVPNSRKNICKKINDEYKKEINKFTACRLIPVGKPFVLNLDYLSEDIGIDHVHLKANIGGEVLFELNLQVSEKVCKELAMARGLDKKAQRKYQQEHYPNGYKIIRRGGTYGTAFIQVEYVAIDRDESYYDIGDDEIMFLGV